MTELKAAQDKSLAQEQAGAGAADAGESSNEGE